MSISEATKTCLQSFTACLENEALMKNAWAENRLADFNLWIANTGALANSRSSLDARLARKQEIISVISNLLLLVSDAVDDCQVLASKLNLDGSIDFGNDQSFLHTLDLLTIDSPPPRPFSPWSSGSSSASSHDELSEPEYPDARVGKLDEVMKNIEAMLEQLAQIAFAIRKSSKRSHIQRADRLFSPGEHPDLQKYLTIIILAKPNYTEGDVKPDKLSSIQKRLVQCNLKRRNRFLYAQRHAKTLLPVKTEDSNPFELNHSDERHTPGPVTVQIQAEGHQSATESPQPDAALGTLRDAMALSIISGTRASAVSDTLILPEAKRRAMTGTSTVVSSTAVNLKYPRGPELRDGAHVFKCPCCCQSLSREFATGNKWRKHISEDLSPYTCILDGCNNPEFLYNTRKQWEQHLLTEHFVREYWICFSCGGTLQFDLYEDFIEHTKVQHGDAVPQSQIQLVADASKRRVPQDINCCPLCEWPKKEDGEVDKHQILDHIAQEVHEFSLKSLPWADDDGQESEERITRSCSKVQAWLEKHDISGAFSDTKPVLERKIDVSSHFYKNQYFGESLGSASSSTSNFRQIDLHDFDQSNDSTSLDTGSGMEKALLKDIDNDEYKARSHYERNLIEDRISALTDALKNQSKLFLKLMCAIAEEDSDAVEKIIEAGANINATYDDGISPLFLAVHLKNKRIADILMQCGADVNWKEPYNGWTALLWAEHKRFNYDLEVAAMKRGIDLSARLHNGWSRCSLRMKNFRQLPLDDTWYEGVTAYEVLRLFQIPDQTAGYTEYLLWQTFDFLMILQEVGTPETLSLDSQKYLDVLIWNMFQDVDPTSDIYDERGIEYIPAIDITVPLFLSMQENNHKKLSFLLNSFEITASEILSVLAFRAHFNGRTPTHDLIERIEVVMLEEQVSSNQPLDGFGLPWDRFKSNVYFGDIYTKCNCGSADIESL